MVRIQDIAKAANVSPATVSRCLRKDPTLSINSETGKRIYDIAVEMGYKNIKTLDVPNEYLVIHKDSHFLDHIDNGYYFSIRSGIEEEIAKNGDICRFVPLSRVDHEKANYAGVLVVGNYPPQDIQHILSCAGTDNIVFVGKLNFLPEGFDTVTYDVAECVRLAMDALMEANIQSVLFIDGKDRCSIPLAFRKSTHVQEYVNFHENISLVASLESEGFGSDAGYHAMRQYIEDGGVIPQAIFSATDPLSIGIIKALDEVGIKVGHDISLVSINGDNSGQWATPTLTSVDYHSQRMGKEAVQLAMQRIKDPHSPTRCVFFRPQLIIGKSILKQA